MSSCSSRFSALSIIYLVILIGLIYAFHLELFVTGVRLYTTAVNNPHAERLLGDYYRKNARLSNELSFSFYTSALQKNKALLASATDIEQANIKLEIGRLYLCGKGVPQSQTEAKHWFNEAQQTLATVKNNGNNNEKLSTQIKEAITMSTVNSVDINSLPICQLQSEVEFFSSIFNPM